MLHFFIGFPIFEYGFKSRMMKTGSKLNDQQALHTVHIWWWLVI